MKVKKGTIKSGAIFLLFSSPNHSLHFFSNKICSYIWWGVITEPALVQNVQVYWYIGVE